MMEKKFEIIHWLSFLGSVAAILIYGTLFLSTLDKRLTVLESKVEELHHLLFSQIKLAQKDVKHGTEHA